ncbi:MAG: hypothetical protein AAGE03_04360 [Pseudomonadota bacterium]
MALQAIKDMFFTITARNDTDRAFRGVNRNLRETDGLAASVSQRMGRAGSAMTRYGAAGSVGSGLVVAAFRDVIGLYDEQARSEAKVRTAVEQTGMAAKLTTEQLLDEAAALQGLTRVGDEAILNGVTAQLLTFKEISGDIFLDAQMGALDLATVLDGDLQSASIMLGKALNDPVKGLSAMGRAGITFTEAQSDIIKGLAETGDIAAAQRLILDEIASAYGGQAIAARDAGAGIADAWANTWGDIKESVGAVLVDLLPPIVDGLESITGWFRSLEPEGQKVVVVFGAMAIALPPLLAALGLLVSGIAAIGAPVAIAIAGLAALGGLWVTLSGEGEDLSAAIDGVSTALDEEKRAAEALNPILDGSRQVSADVAAQKLAEARARYANVQAIADEARALAQQTLDTSLSTFNTSDLDPNGGFTVRDGRDFFNTGPRSVADVIGEDAAEAGRQLARAEAAVRVVDDQIDALEKLSATGTAAATGGIEPLATSVDNVSDAIRGSGGGGGRGSSGGGLIGAVEELDVAVEEVAESPVWDTLKDNFKGLIFEGQKLGDAWDNIFRAALDRVFDLAFTPAWDRIWDGLEGVVSGGSGGGGGQGGGSVVNTATGFFGNILGLDTGGDVSVRGRGGVDRNLTVLRTSDTENVRVRRPGDSMGDRAVNVNIYTQDAKSFEGSQSQVAMTMRRALAAADRAA